MKNNETKDFEDLKNKILENPELIEQMEESLKDNDLVD